MVIIDGQNIKMTRGDSASIVFRALNGDGDTYDELDNGDVLQFQFGKKYGSPICVKRNVYRPEMDLDDFYTIHLEPDDTKYYTVEGEIRELKFADYVYDVSIICSGEVCTFIWEDEDHQPKLTLLKEVDKGVENA